MKHIKLVIFIVTFFIFISSTIYSKDIEKTILIIHSYHQGYEWCDGIQKGIMDVLSKKSNLEIYVEYMDFIRAGGNEIFLNKLEQLYKIKYSSKKIDALIVVDDNAFDFVLKRREKLFKNIPVVFCGVNDFKKEMIKGQKNITGINEEKSIKETIELALKIAKKVKKIGVIAGERLSEKRNLKLFINEAKIIPKHIELIYLAGLELSDIVEKVKTFSKDDVIFYLSYLNSPSGIVHRNEDNLKMLSENTRAMIFTVSDHMVKNGVIGGKVTYAVSQGEEAAKMTLKIVTGTSADKIPIVMKSPNIYLFDGLMLERHNIPLATLPKDSIIINKTAKEISEKYFGTIKNGFFSHELFENHGTVMLIIDPKTGTIIDANNRAKLFYGYEKLIGKKIQEINTLNEEELREEMERAKKLQKNYFNFKHRLSNGEVRDVEVYSYPVELNKIPLLFSIIFDVTDKLLMEKKAKEEEKTILKIFIALSIVSFALIFLLLIYLRKKKLFEKEILEKNKILEEAQKEIKTLKGIIPICMHCKKIRDDKGYWNQLEKYISEHTDALFSHALCPDCAEKYYNFKEK